MKYKISFKLFIFYLLTVFYLLTLLFLIIFYLNTFIHRIIRWINWCKKKNCFFLTVAFRKKYGVAHNKLFWIIFLKSNNMFSLHQLIHFIILCIKALRYSYQKMISLEESYYVKEIVQFHSKKWWSPRDIKNWFFFF